MTPEILASEMHLFTSMKPDGCCLRHVVLEGKSGSDDVLDALAESKRRRCEMCKTMAMQLLSVMPHDRQDAVTRFMNRRGMPDANA